jgi:hypothetical protein
MPRYFVSACLSVGIALVRDHGLDESDKATRFAPRDQGLLVGLRAQSALAGLPLLSFPWGAP